MAITLQYILASYGLMIGVCILALAIGTYLWVIAMTKCMKRILFAISQHADAEIDRSVLSEQLIEFIEYHSRVKRLSKNGIQHVFLIQNERLKKMFFCGCDF